MGKIYPLKQEIHRTRDQCEQIAEDIRKEYGGKRIPVDPVKIAEMINVNVFLAKFGNPETSGLICREGNRTSILLNSADMASKQRFTIAHELGHFFLHLDTIYGNFVDTYKTINETKIQEDFRETEANQFATALLMPRSFVFLEARNFDTMFDLALFFDVSVNTMTKI